MTFGDNLATAMRQREISVRKLAATWRPGNPESGRRNLHKYLRGTEPTDRVAAEIARALDLPVEELRSNGTDDEEEDALAMVHRLLLEVQALSAKIDRAEARKRQSA